MLAEGVKSLDMSRVKMLKVLNSRSATLGSRFFGMETELAIVKLSIPIADTVYGLHR